MNTSFHLGQALLLVLLSQIFLTLAFVPRKGLQAESQPGVIQICGVRSEGDDDIFAAHRIVGGTSAKKKEFKWQVSMRKKSRKGKHICGGTVIGESWIVTAAHCTIDTSKRAVVFVAGEHLIKNDDGTEQSRQADEFFNHDSYNDRTQENDIALVRLKEPYDFTSFNVAPACLPDPMEKFDGQCVVTGWGKRKEGGRNANALQKVWINIVSDSSCTRDLKKVGYNDKIANSMICAGEKAGGKDACQGDSGGPFVCAGKGNLPVLVGVVSWGIGCARRGIPGVYTEVSHFVKWIANTMKKNPVGTFIRQTDEDSIQLTNSEQQHSRIQEIIPVQVESPNAQPTPEIWHMIHQIWSSFPLQGWPLPVISQQNRDPLGESSESDESDEWFESSEEDK